MKGPQRYDGKLDQINKEYKEKSDLYSKATSYAKSMITSALTDTI